MTKKRYEYIDALRAIAILGVIMVHISIAVRLTGFLGDIIGLGAKGVQLFYFISAYTIFLTYNSSRSKVPNSYSSFFLRRFFRIGPLYYSAIIYYTIQTFFFTDDLLSPLGITLNFFFLHGFFPNHINSIVPGGWSIAVEMSFYLLVPLLTFLLKSFKGSVFFLIACVLFQFLSNFYLKMNPFDFPTEVWNKYLYWFLPNQMVCFAFGIVFYFVLDAYKQSTGIRTVGAYYILLFILTVLFVLDFYFSKVHIFNIDFIVMIATSLIVYFLYRHPVKLIVNIITISIGKVSYSMYLIHFAVIFWLNKFNIFDSGISSSPVVFFIFMFLLVASVTYFFSRLSYQYIELPMQQYAKELIEKRATKNNASSLLDPQPLSEKSVGPIRILSDNRSKRI